MLKIIIKNYCFKSYSYILLFWKEYSISYSLIIFNHYKKIYGENMSNSLVNDKIYKYFPDNKILKVM